MKLQRCRDDNTLSSKGLMLFVCTVHVHAPETKRNEVMINAFCFFEILNVRQFITANCFYLGFILVAFLHFNCLFHETSQCRVIGSLFKSKSRQ